jgi:hypothetical protein
LAVSANKKTEGRLKLLRQPRAGGWRRRLPSCRICNLAVMNISICNAQPRHTGYIKNICCFFRITNAYTLSCRIANSAERKGRKKISPRLRRWRKGAKRFHRVSAAGGRARKDFAASPPLAEGRKKISPRLRRWRKGAKRFRRVSAAGGRARKDFALARRNRACKAGALLLYPTQAGACAERGEGRRRLEPAPGGGGWTTQAGACAGRREGDAGWSLRRAEDLHSIAVARAGRNKKAIPAIGMAFGGIRSYSMPPSLNAEVRRPAMH